MKLCNLRSRLYYLVPHTSLDLLRLSYAIVKASIRELKVESAESEGSECSVQLPIN